MKKVLHVVSCLELGGTEAFIMNHYRKLNREKVQFDFLVCREKAYPYDEEIRSLGGKIFYTIPPKAKDAVPFIRRCTAVMRGYDVVHSHMNIDNAWALLAAKLAGVPIRVSHSHDTTGKGGSFAKRAFHALETQLLKRCATEYLACSKLAGDYLYGERSFALRGRVIRNGITPERFVSVPEQDVSALRREFDLPDSCGLVVGNITRFEPKKNQLFLVSVFREILRRRPDAVLLLGGPDGGMLAQTQQAAAEAGISDRVRWIGARQDIPACLKLIDLYLFPSRYEGLGIVLLEAQASGCRCAVSDVIPGEVDVGLGLISFHDLRAPAAQWAEEILSALPSGERPNPAQVLKAFQDTGFDAQLSMQTLLAIYQCG